MQLKVKFTTLYAANFVLLFPLLACDRTVDDANDPEWARLGYSLAGGKLVLYGGKGHEQYLGCLSCSKYELESITNNYGTYGNRYAANSIWNVYGLYGSKYSPYSWRNPYATQPPVILDEDGNIYGYFTVNKYYPNRVSMNWLEKTFGIEFDE